MTTTEPLRPGAEHTIGPWTFRFSGARLADIFHAESDQALDAIDCGYDWQTGTSTATRETFEACCAEWVRDGASDVIVNVLPYAS